MPLIEECFVCRREPQNVEDKNTVAVVCERWVSHWSCAKIFQPVDVDVSLTAEK